MCLIGHSILEFRGENSFGIINIAIYTNYLKPQRLILHRQLLQTDKKSGLSQRPEPLQH